MSSDAGKAGVVEVSRALDQLKLPPKLVLRSPSLVRAGL
jgi:hypothetical protein